MTVDERHAVAAAHVRRLAACFDRLCSHIGYTFLALVAVVCVAELLSMVVVWVYHGAYARLSVIAPGIAARETDHRWFSLRNRLMDDTRRASGVYAGQPWADAFVTESGDVVSRWGPRYEPFRVWGNREAHGTYINLDTYPTGIWRRTVNSCTPGAAQTTRVWVLGGSVILGLDTPDFATIPSYLSRALTTVDRCIEVTNMGVVAYVINQYAVLLQDLLKRGFRPDIVVALGGINEIDVGIYSPGLAWAHDDLFDIRSRLDNPLRSRALLERSYALEIVRAASQRLAPREAVAVTDTGDRVPVDLSVAGLKRQSEAVLDNYEATIDLMQVLARAYHFDFHVFWQPELHVGRPYPTAFERMLLDHPAFNRDPERGRVIEAVYEEAERRAATNKRFAFLGRVFEGVAEPVYTDGLHLGPRGNEIMAGAMAAALSR